MALWRRTGHHDGFVCTELFEQSSGIYSRFLNSFILTIKSFCTIPGKPVLHIALVMTSVPTKSPKAPAPALNTTPSRIRLPTTPINQPHHPNNVGQSKRSPARRIHPPTRDRARRPPFRRIPLPLQGTPLKPNHSIHPSIHSDPSHLNN